MADNTTARLTELQAVNRMLAGIGQAPITQAGLTNAANPDVAMATQTLYEVSRQIQAEGWSFNKEYNVETTFDGTTRKLSAVGANVMQVDASQNEFRNRGVDTILKQDGTAMRIYNKRDHTFFFDYTPEVDITYYRVFTECPAPIQYLIVDEAAALLCMRIVGDGQQYQFLKARAQECRAYAMEYETNQGDYTFFGQPKHGNYYVSYEPFHALRR